MTKNLFAEKLVHYILTNQELLLQEAESQFRLDMESLKADEQNGDFEHKHITTEQINHRFLDINLVCLHTVYKQPFIRVRYALSNMKTGERVGEYRWEGSFNEQKNELEHWDDFLIIWDRKDS